MLLNDYRGINGVIETATDPIIDTDPTLTPRKLRTRCYVNGTARRDYLVALYTAANDPLMYAQDVQP